MPRPARGPRQQAGGAYAWLRDREEQSHQSWLDSPHSRGGTGTYPRHHILGKLRRGEPLVKSRDVVYDVVV